MIVVNAHAVRKWTFTASLLLGAQEGQDRRFSFPRSAAYLRHSIGSGGDRAVQGAAAPRA